ncbi:ketopantoate reductase family protein [Alkalihalobacillus sp. MEB130]|uniref:ketopantoate reductase family protein n=1 Tax=Alkalihalobacillus sp. MEB130 TaxID=2976704 RepID=UPI0028DDAC28|nr:ketopantoate reductase family protein [Alkalihalobacillus sp. MEB130]MDT8861132.1 ketopantoate reductase family protein [Alkalihalobacillus sp. MEB130]
MNIVVLGAGAVGGYFGSKLAANENVTFLVRPKRVKQLKKRGLRVQSTYGNFTIQPCIEVEAEKVISPQLVIVALKNYQLEQAVPQLETLVQNGAKILPLLNGVEHLDFLVSKFGEQQVLGGICYIESTLNEENDIIHTSQLHDVVFGPISDGDKPLLSNIRESFEQAAIPVTLSETIVVDMWKKFIFLSTLSGITSVSRKPIVVALADPKLSQFSLDLIKEVVEIARAKEVKLPGDIVDTIFVKLENLSPTMTSSMHRDLEKGMPIELDSLQGFLVRSAEKYSIETPCLRAIYAILHPFKNGQI